MEDSQTFTDILSVFAHYGFRKASMADLAEAAGVTRQTLYNRFRTKEAVLDFAVEGYVRNALQKASAELNAETASVDSCLLNAFSNWVGNLVSLLKNSPHGSEVMDMGTQSIKRSHIDHHLTFEREIAAFLINRGVCKTESEALDITFLLMMSSKGLLLKSETGEQFQDGMTRLIRTAVPGLEQPAFN